MTVGYYRTKILTLLAVLALSASISMRAQQLQASLSHYSTDNGLCSNAIASLHQDDYGFLWLATWNGVSRFDGYNFYNYKTGITSGIRGMHNRVDHMTIDLSQNVWLKMYDGRIFVINRMTDRIEDPLEGLADIMSSAQTISLHHTLQVAVTYWCFSRMSACIKCALTVSASNET